MRLGIATDVVSRHGFDLGQYAHHFQSELSVEAMLALVKDLEESLVRAATAAAVVGADKAAKPGRRNENAAARPVHGRSEPVAAVPSLTTAAPASMQPAGGIAISMGKRAVPMATTPVVPAAPAAAEENGHFTGKSCHINPAL